MLAMKLYKVFILHDVAMRFGIFFILFMSWLSSDVDGAWQAIKTRDGVLVKVVVRGQDNGAKPSDIYEHPDRSSAVIPLNEPLKIQRILLSFAINDLRCDIHASDTTLDRILKWQYDSRMTIRRRVVMKLPGDRIELARIVAQ